MAFFWIDETRDLYISYENLLKQINSCNAIPKYIRSANPYHMLVDLVVGMIHGKEIVLLDSDFSDNEISLMGINLQELNTVIEINNAIKFSDIQHVAERVSEEPWKLWMFTSGTTGLPKKVCHSMKTLGRNVRSGTRHIHDVWAFAYRFSHMAGMQVLLQALVNQNQMVYVFESTPQEVVELIRKYHCTHISATPTFYRNITPFIKEELPYLTDMTMGGEKYDKELWNRMKAILPHTRIHNIYAATETGSILNATEDGFEVPQNIKDKVRISDTNELLVHRSLLGEFPVDSEWYNTQDLVEVRNGKIHFLSRESDLINVGGYKVNPLEVEEAMMAVPGIIDCIVKGKSNSVLGNILVAEVIKDASYSEQDVKKLIQCNLKEKLQSFKIPRMVKFVDAIERTRSGKKVRK